MSQIQFIQVTPTELANLISENVIEVLKLQQHPNIATAIVPEKELLTRQETADLLQISKVTLHDRVNNKLLKPYKMGKRTYFRRSEVLECLYSTNNSDYKFLAGSKPVTKNA